MAWGTCPCFYLEILSGGLTCFGVSPDDTCCHECEGADSGAENSLTVNAVNSSRTNGCPCLDTIGTMHELPQAEDQDLFAGDDVLLVDQTLILCPPALAVEGGNLTTGAEPGPRLQSVVLLV